MNRGELYNSTHAMNNAVRPATVTIVFLSSTAEDLARYRAAAREAAIAAGCLPRMMEHFAASAPLEMAVMRKAAIGDWRLAAAAAQCRRQDRRLPSCCDGAARGQPRPRASDARLLRCPSCPRACTNRWP